MNKGEILNKIIELRHIRTLLSNFIEVDISEDNRIYTSFSIVETGRFSSHEDETGGGTHLQNIPPEVRKIFISDDGMKLVEADKSQGEVRIVAWLAREERMKEVFKYGGDIHKKNASYIFGCNIDNVTTGQRYLAKRMVHASNYGMGINTMATYCGISKREAEIAQKKYFDAFPRIKVWQNEIIGEVGKMRSLTNPFGRKRIFFDRMSDNLYREAFAFIPQSTLVDDLNRGMIELFMRGEPRLQILHQGHDSLLWQTHDVEWSIELARDCLEQEFVCGGDVLKIPVEFKVGENWGTMHEYK